MTKGTTTVGSTFVSAILETGLSNMTVSPANATFVNTTLVDSHASTVDDLLYHDMGIVNLVSIFQSFLAVITFLVFVFVLAFIPWVQRSFSSMLSPKNILLFGLAFFTGVSMAGYAAHTLKKDRTTASLIVVPIAFAELFYLSFSMERSRDVLRIQSSPMVYRVFQGIYYFTVVCLFIPAILILADYEHQFWYNVTTVVAAAGVVLLDCFFIHKTSRYIFKRTVEVSEVKGPDATGTRYYPIIARHQFASSCSAVLMILFYLIQNILAGRTGATMQDVYIFYLLEILYCLCAVSVSTSLVFMKVKLLAVKNDLFGWDWNRG